MWERPLAERPPGCSVRKLAKKRLVTRLILASCGLLACAYAIQYAIVRSNPLILVGCLIVIAAVGRLIQILDTLRRAEYRAVRGAEAEEQVGALLNRLPSDCLVLHDLNSRYGNIDHLVLRLDGAIFLLETKSHRGTITEFNGQLRRNGKPLEKSFLRQTLRNVTWLRGFLASHFNVSPWVHAAVVFPNANVAVQGPLNNVQILRLDALSNWMTQAQPNADTAKALKNRFEDVRTRLLSYRDHFMVLNIARATALALFAVTALAASVLLPSLIANHVLTAFTPQSRSAPALPFGTIVRARTPSPLPDTNSLRELLDSGNAGDAVAQDKLGDFYRDSDQERAVYWYGEAARHGVANSQYQLAHILLSWASSTVAKKDVAARHADEGVPWLVRAANQGHKPAQVELGQLYCDGKFVSRDLVEAYKWFTLAAGDGASLDFAVNLGKTYRNDVMRKLSSVELAEGDRRVADFSVNTGDYVPMPEPAYLQHITLNGITGVAPRVLAIINGKTLGAGESTMLNVDARSVTIHCLSIRTDVVTISIDGFDSPKQLHLH